MVVVEVVWGWLPSSGALVPSQPAQSLEEPVSNTMRRTAAVGLEVAGVDGAERRVMDWDVVGTVVASQSSSQAATSTGTRSIDKEALILTLTLPQAA